MEFKIWGIIFLTLFALSANAERKIVCYFTSWSTYRVGAGKFDISNVDPNACTHLIYAFAGLDKWTGKVQVLDPWQELPDNYGRDGFRRFNGLKQINPKLKTLIAVGGWNEGSEKFSYVASSPIYRKNFIDSIVMLIKQYGFDGLDFDWQYPNQRGGSPNDKTNYVQWLKEIYEKFQTEGFILSVGVASTEQSADQSYIIPEMHKYVDFINLLTFEMHGVWDKMTGFNAPLVAAVDQNEFQSQISVEAAVTYWRKQGVPAEKLILGIASYGKSFQLANENMVTPGSPIVAPGFAGEYTRQSGILGYNEICQYIRNNWKMEFDRTQKCNYAYNHYQWVGYDDVEALNAKMMFLISRDLGGAMMWSLDTDDFRGGCGEKYPLLKTINKLIGPNQG